jgi:hypothetical protein
VLTASARLPGSCSAEYQAIDRAHRLGQHKPIRAVRFVVRNTVEERILRLQDKKRLIFEGTVGGDAAALGQLSEEVTPDGRPLPTIPHSRPSSLHPDRPCELTRTRTHIPGPLAHLFSARDVRWQDLKFLFQN